MRTKLWEKIAGSVIWILLVAFLVLGAVGGLAYLIKIFFVQ